MPYFQWLDILFLVQKPPLVGHPSRWTSTSEAMVLFKVGVSCYAAVLSDAKLKGFSSSSARTGQRGQGFAAFFSSQTVVLMGVHGIL